MNTSRWSRQRANAWYEEQPWLVGCNFVPSTAINQLELWQEDTFDPETIDRELGWAAGIGFNTARVYLHDLLWDADASGFRDRIGHYLRIAGSHGIRTMFVLFDDCWHDNPRLGRQPEPVPGIHNSGWAMSPGSAAVGDRRQWPRLEAYVGDIVRAFGSDERVLAWDVYNEVGNRFMPAMNAPWHRRIPSQARTYVRHVLQRSPSLDLMDAAFGWARRSKPEQPLTSAVYYPFPKINHAVLTQSDVISFHNYEGPEALEKQITELKVHGRPILCTEWLARANGSRLETHLPLFHREKVGCYNWGFVNGKTQTIYSWQDRGGEKEPAEWYHDILQPDGTPFRQEETNLIRHLTTGANS